MEQEMHEDRSEIQEFFEGRSVLITGAAGYVGGVLLEQLLRLCPGIVEIFILLREKKGNTPEMRKDVILGKLIFCKVKEDNPKAMEKVHAISGELTEDDLGITPDDLNKLQENVSVVFHCAASISFRKTFSFMLMNNVIGTENVINLCRKLPKIAAFIHTSTAFSNSCNKVIKEEVYQMPVPVKKIVQATRAGDEKFLTSLEKKYSKNWANLYTFSKSIGENVVAEETADIPTAIVRPSIIDHIWKGSLPGYVENGNAFANTTYGVMTGALQVALINSNNCVDTIPVDIVANTLIVAAWGVATKRMSSPMVFNCISSNTVTLTWGDLFKDFMNKSYHGLSPYTFRSAGTRFIPNTPLYLFLAFLYHHIPAYIMDMHARLTGGEPKFVKFSKILDQSMLDVRPFTMHEFCFESANFEGLKYFLNKNDQVVFPTDLSEYSFSYIMENVSVNEICQFKNDDINLRYRQVALAERNQMIMKIYKSFLLFLLILFVWFFVKTLLHIIK